MSNKNTQPAPSYSITRCPKCNSKTVIICMSYPNAGYINQCSKCNWSICTVE